LTYEVERYGEPKLLTNLPYVLSGSKNWTATAPVYSGTPIACQFLIDGQALRHSYNDISLTRAALGPNRPAQH
jgi:hypothetical protein